MTIRNDCNGHRILLTAAVRNAYSHDYSNHARISSPRPQIVVKGRTDMARLAFACFFAGALIAVLGCSIEKEKPTKSATSDTSTLPKEGDPADVTALTKGNNEFAFALYKKLAEKEGNVFFSPYSISSALGMTYAGARGPTAEEMAKVLGITTLGEKVHPANAELARRLKSSGGKDKVEFHIANALWGQQGMSFLPDFLNLTKRHYNGGFRELDFMGDTEGARKTINGWVGEQTRDKIPELLKRDTVTSNTKLVLTNAIYFKGNWARNFDPKETKDGIFYRSPTDKVTVPFMKQTADLRYAEVADAQVLELPYTGNGFSMVVVLPRKAEDIGDVEAALCGGAIDHCLAKAGECEVEVILPKFKLRVPVALGPPLKELGMRKAFDDADFSGLTGSREFQISAVIHEAFIALDEKGTEAAAGTAVDVGNNAKLVVAFRADRPFLVAIRHRETGCIVFFGKVADPIQQK